MRQGETDQAKLDTEYVPNEKSHQWWLFSLLPLLTKDAAISR
jgi:hypothetical protein